MKDKLKILIQNVPLQRRHAIAIIITSVFVIVVVFIFYPASKSGSMNTSHDESASNDNFGDDGSIVAVVGTENFSIADNAISNNSWPGEIISLNNLQVQPDRE